MSTNNELKAVALFLKEKVSPKIKLQRPNNSNVHEYELVNPNVFIGWIPPNGYLPENMESAMPCLLVGFDEGEDGGEQSEYKIRISAVVFSPGLHKPDGQIVNYTPDYEGYRDLLNLIDLTKAEISKYRILGNKLSVDLPIKWGMYMEQPYPYWYGWITFTAKSSSYPISELSKNYL